MTQCTKCQLGIQSTPNFKSCNATSIIFCNIPNFLKDFTPDSELRTTENALNPAFISWLDKELSNKVTKSSSYVRAKSFLFVCLQSLLLLDQTNPIFDAKIDVGVSFLMLIQLLGTRSIVALKLPNEIVSNKI
jgi:hypothetical protein